MKYGFLNMFDKLTLAVLYFRANSMLTRIAFFVEKQFSGDAFVVEKSISFLVENVVGTTVVVIFYWKSLLSFLLNPNATALATEVAADQIRVAATLPSKVEAPVSTLLIAN